MCFLYAFYNNNNNNNNNSNADNKVQRRSVCKYCYNQNESDQPNTNLRTKTAAMFVEELSQ